MQKIKQKRSQVCDVPHAMPIPVIQTWNDAITDDKRLVEKEGEGGRWRVSNGIGLFAIYPPFFSFITSIHGKGKKKLWNESYIQSVTFVFLHMDFFLCPLLELYQPYLIPSPPPNSSNAQTPLQKHAITGLCRANKIGKTRWRRDYRWQRLVEGFNGICQHRQSTQMEKLP